MLFLHPESALFEEFVSVVIAPRHIFLFDISPCGIAFVMRHIGLFENSVLEFVNAHEVRNAAYRAVKMCEDAVFYVVAEEQLQKAESSVLSSQDTLQTHAPLHVSAHQHRRQYR